MVKTPTEKQIAFADAIASALGLDFPQSSKDFTRAKYWAFIQQNVEEYRYALLEAAVDEDDLYATCARDVWCEEY